MAARTDRAPKRHNQQPAARPGRAGLVDPTGAAADASLDYGLGAAGLAATLSHVRGATLANVAGRLQREQGNAYVQRVLAAVTARRGHPQSPSLQRAPGAGKPANKAPRPPSFELAGVKFAVDGQAVRPAGKGGKSGGWSFTLVAPVPAVGPAPSPAPAAVEFDAERAMPNRQYVPAGGSPRPLLERARVKVDGGKATITPIVVVLMGAKAPELTIALDASERGATKSVTVGDGSAEQLECTFAAGFTPQPGDVVQLGGDRKEIYVFSRLDPGDGTKKATAVEGFFHLGYETKIQGGVGVEGANRAPFATTFAALKKSGAVAGAEGDIFALVSDIEGGFATVQNADRGVLSFGFGQWTAMADLPGMLKSMPDDVFRRSLGKYGLGLSTPSLGAYAHVRKFLPGPKAQFERAIKPLQLHALGEGCMLLDNKELVSDKLYKTAEKWAGDLGEALAKAQAAKAALGDPKTAEAAGRTLAGLWKVLAGLPGTGKKPKEPDKLADALIQVSTDAQAAAAAVVSGCLSVELLRSNEWALRFQVAGRDPAVQAAEAHHAFKQLNDLRNEAAPGASGVTNGQLMQSRQAQAVLFSSWLNNPSGAKTGMRQAIAEFAKEQAKQHGADAKAKAEWEAFPWPVGDKRWATLYTGAAQDQFEALAQAKMLPHTHSPQRRKAILNK